MWPCPLRNDRSLPLVCEISAETAPFSKAFFLAVQKEAIRDWQATSGAIKRAEALAGVVLQNGAKNILVAAVISTTGFTIGESGE